MGFFKKIPNSILCGVVLFPHDSPVFFMNFNQPNPVPGRWSKRYTGWTGFLFRLDFIQNPSKFESGASISNPFYGGYIQNGKKSSVC